MRITVAQLQAKVDYLNKVTGNPPAAYVKDGDKYIGQIGHYMLDGAYGGYALEQIMSESGGVSVILSRTSKREYLNGIELGQKGTKP